MKTLNMNIHSQLLLTDTLTEHICYVVIHGVS